MESQSVLAAYVLVIQVVKNVYARVGQWGIHLDKASDE